MMVPPRRPDCLDGDGIHAQAARWVARLAADDVSASDRAEFQEWLARSPEHLRAYGAAQQTWSDLDALAGLASADGQVLPDALRGEVERCGAMVNTTVAGPWRPAGVRRAALLAAGLILAALGGMWMSQARRQPVPGIQAVASELRTRIGERLQTMLADGSVVWLNTDTELQVAFSASRRSVHLARGEAYFDVAKDPSRPFVVSVGDRTITAVGTAFNVYRRGDETRVTVLEGKVEVARRAPAQVKAVPPVKKAVPAAGSPLPAPIAVEVPQQVTATQMSSSVPSRPKPNAKVRRFLLSATAALPSGRAPRSQVTCTLCCCR